MKSTLSITIVVTSALVSQLAMADIQSNIRSQQNVTNEVVGGSLALAGTAGVYGSYRMIKQFNKIDSPKLQRINDEITRLTRILGQESPFVVEKQRALQAAMKLHSIESVNEAIRTTKQVQAAVGTLSNPQSLAVAQQAGANVDELAPFLTKLQGSLEEALKGHAVSAQQKRELITQAQAELEAARSVASADAQDVAYELDKHVIARAQYFRDAAKFTRGGRFVKLGGGALLGVVSVAAIGSSGFIAYTVIVDGATPRPATAEETSAIIGDSVATAQASK